MTVTFIVSGNPTARRNRPRPWPWRRGVRQLFEAIIGPIEKLSEILPHLLGLFGIEPSQVSGISHELSKVLDGELSAFLAFNLGKIIGQSHFQ